MWSWSCDGAMSSTVGPGRQHAVYSETVPLCLVLGVFGLDVGQLVGYVSGAYSWPVLLPCCPLWLHVAVVHGAQFAVIPFDGVRCGCALLVPLASKLAL